MRILATRSMLVVVVLSVGLLPATCWMQAGPVDETYKAERRRAIDLFNQNKHLEALSLFEDLAAKSPNDHEVLLGLAGCLVRHSSTIEDEKQAATERVRARGLLIRAKDLGNTSTLLENLLQAIPADGIVNYSPSPVDQAMRLAEAAFARQDFDEAIKNYSKVLELDPKRYSATLFIGDTYFTKKDFAKAAEWYERAIQLDPNRETAYRYYGDMLAKNGEVATSRKRFIQAVVAEPYNPITWRGLRYWAQANGVQLQEIHIRAGSEVSQKGDKNFTLTLDEKQSGDVSAAWIAYALTKTVWRMSEFKKHCPQEKEYRHSLEEESQALTSAAEVLTADKEKKKAAVANDADLAALLKIYEAKMIEPYVLLSAPDDGIARDYGVYRDKNRDKLEQYLSEFVVPLPASPKK
jgi:tetratricopeptide (TPR) repeat protein